MSEVKRYDLAMSIVHPTITHRESEQGEWIKASDINKIKADAVLASIADIGTNEPFARIIVNHVKNYAEKIRKGEVNE